MVKELWRHDVRLSDGRLVLRPISNDKAFKFQFENFNKKGFAGKFSLGHRGQLRYFLNLTHREKHISQIQDICHYQDEPVDPPQACLVNHNDKDENG